MTEFEFYSLAYESTQALQTEETTFLTILFGYLLASHFLGAKVSRVQVTVFNAIYLVLASGLIFNMWIHWAGTAHWLREAASKNPFEASTDGDIHMVVATAVYISLVIVSLYFMWTIRHPKTE
jgi:hypothetical protein